MDAYAQKIEKLDNGKFALRGVPIFAVHKRENKNFDENYLRAVVERQKDLKTRGHLPRVTLGHTSDDISDPGPPVLGFADNFRFSEREGLLYADFVDLPEEVKDAVVNNQLPGISCEPHISHPEISVVAMLRGKPGWLRLPDIRYVDTAERLKFAENNNVDRRNLMIPGLKRAVALSLNTKAIGGSVLRYAGDAIDKVDPADLQDKEKIKALLEEVLSEWAEENESDEPDVIVNADGDDDQLKATKPDGTEIDEDEDEDEEDDKDVKQYSELPKEQNNAMWARVTKAGGKRRNKGQKYVKSSMKGNWPAFPGEDKKKHADNGYVMRYAEQISKLQKKVDQIQQEKDRSEWVIRYAEACPGADAKTRDSVVAQLLAHPLDQREKLFSMLTKRAPSLQAIGADTFKYADNSDAAFKTFYEQNRAKYRGNTIKARQDFAKTKGK